MTSTFDNIYIFNLYLYVQYFVIKTFNIMEKKKLITLKKIFTYSKTWSTKVSSHNYKIQQKNGIKTKGSVNVYYVMGFRPS